MTATKHVGRPDVDRVSDDDLLRRFRPIFTRIAEGAAARERRRELPHEPIGWLRDAGFGAVRLPIADGGSGASISQLFRLLVELAEADSNIPQALRAHFGFTEERLHSADSPIRDRWLRRVADGAIIGNATTEIGPTATGAFQTTLSEAGRVDGTKHYSTGSLYADWIAVGVSGADGESAFALVAAGDSGVDLVDDWNGFGQRLTASGTTTLTDVPVDPDDVFWHTERTPNYMIAFYQLVLLATLAGIGRAVVRDVVEYVQTRRRAFSHASADLPREDPLVQETVGRIQAAVFAAEAATAAAVATLERINAERLNGAPDESLFDAAEITVSTAHIVVVDRVLEAATALFEVGGASSVDADRALDRHWRNARTVSVHNPVIYKARVIGDHLLNQARPAYAWVVGVRS